MWVQYCLMQSQTLIPPSLEPGGQERVGNKENGKKITSESEKREREQTDGE